MRKKSHLSLTRYLISNFSVEDLRKHKGSFYLGSILPDCIPSFLYRKHCIEDTFDILKKEMKRLIDGFGDGKNINSYYCRHLGIITHYIADYFTLPHNSIFEGNMKDHCKYENDLKLRLREYVKSEDVKKEREFDILSVSIDDICDYIKEEHNNYIKGEHSYVETDIEFIVELSHKVVDMLLSIFEEKKMLKLLATV